MCYSESCAIVSIIQCVLHSNNIYYMHAMLAVTSTAYILHYIPHCHAKLYVMVHESYYILCMKSCTSCRQ